jgi:predicted CXXCH cytochrome family protein
MSSTQAPVNPRISPVPPTRRRSALGLLAALLNGVLVLGGLGLFVTGGYHFAQQSATPRPAPPPVTMADVDWRSPESSVYCLACHWNVGLATAGLGVQRGHSHNVALNETQLNAVRDMRTIAGPGNTLICMSCHSLDAVNRPFMLADTLEDSHLCQRCHPGHYARNTRHDLRVSAPQEKNRRNQTAAEGGPCSACHLAHDYAREIVPSPLDPDGYCITCHGQYGVAAGHARTQTMEHPESHCLQCHNSHDASHPAFLRQSPPALCTECHAQYDGGALAGMHPLGRMDAAVPSSLVSAGGSAGADGHQVDCATCHAVHQAGHDRLLVLNNRSNELCLACHADALSAENGGMLSQHGQSPVLDAPQRAVVAGWGMPLGPNGELLCVSCHRVHNAEKDAHLLAARPKYGETCTACHPNEGAIAGTPHDLTLKFPTAENRAGLTPQGAGTCSACHMAHQFPRERVPGPGDAAGRCLSCHLAGRIAQARASGGAEHPGTNCRDCHNPHQPGPGRFLTQPEAQLCASCHANEQKLCGGPHDLTQAARPQKWNAAAREHGGVCLSCHVPHGGDRPDLFRVGAGQAVGNHDEVCLACHADAAWNAPQTGAIHPQLISADEQRVELKLVPRDDTGALRMGCRTCHDPHGGASPVHLARVADGAPTESLCLHCHEEKQYIRYTGHAPEKLADLGLDTDSCKPCHAMHADRAGAWGTMLSTRFLPKCESAAGEAECVPCLSCHHENGPAPFQRIATHPPRMLAAVGATGDAGHLPLFDADGREAPQGQVVCRTCHTSHGRLDLLKIMADNPDWTPEQQHAMRAQLRPFLEPNTCSACHGAKARLLFLRFHDPASRTGRGTPPVR